MQRYFFNVFDGVDTFDKTGKMLPNKNAVRLHMMSKGTEILSEGDVPQGGWRMEILDEHGKIVCGMHFGIEDEEQA